METSSSAKSSLLPIAKNVFRILILILVVWGLWRTVDQARDEFRQREFSLVGVQYGWLITAGIVYLAGLAPCWLFWTAALRAMGQQPTWLAALRAYFIGHLGKYVPGKALVVLLRAGLLKGRVDMAVAAVSVFVETLTMMAVGAALAAAVLALRHHDDPLLLCLSVGLLLAAGAPTAPPLFRRLVRLVKADKASPQMNAALGGLRLGLMARGWTLIAVGWVLIGCSLAAVLESLPGVDLVWTQTLPLLTAAVALAMAAGFLSLLPGGVGVRELVIIPLLAPQFGEAHAIIAAVLLRVVWLIAESAMAMVLYFAKG